MRSVAGEGWLQTRSRAFPPLLMGEQLLNIKRRNRENGEGKRIGACERAG